MKVLPASIPATGHFNPFLVVARILKKAGHEPVIYTSKLFRDKLVLVCSDSRDVVRAIELSRAA
jgi:hypothetical protein